MFCSRLRVVLQLSTEHSSRQQLTGPATLELESAVQSAAWPHCTEDDIVLFQIYLLFTVMLVQDLDGTVAYSKHCTVTQDNKFEFPNRSHEQSEVEICECMIIIIII